MSAPPLTIRPGLELSCLLMDEALAEVEAYFTDKADTGCDDRPNTEMRLATSMQRVRATLARIARSRDPVGPSQGRLRTTPP
jgi:hypothetical protein